MNQDQINQARWGKILEWLHTILFLRGEELGFNPAHVNTASLLRALHYVGSEEATSAPCAPCRYYVTPDSWITFEWNEGRKALVFTDTEVRCTRKEKLVSPAGEEVDVVIWKSTTNLEDICTRLITQKINQTDNYLKEIQVLEQRLDQYRSEEQNEPVSGVPPMTQEDEVTFLCRDLANIVTAGHVLAEAASRVIVHYDGVHRLSLAVSEWWRAVADQGNRGE